MATRRSETAGPYRDVLRVETEGRRQYVVLVCGHRQLGNPRYPRRRGAYCMECEREPVVAETPNTQDKGPLNG